MKNQLKKNRKKQIFLMISGVGAGLLGLFVLAIVVLPAICPSCAGWIGLPPSHGTSTQINKSGNVPVGTKPGERAPDFTLMDVDGNRFQLSDLRGKPVIVYFSAAWCIPCIPETQELARLKARYGDLEVVWIGVDPASDSRQSLREHRRKYAREDFIYALDTPSNEVARKYGVYALGTLYLLDSQGLIAFKGIRPVGKKDFEQALEQVVNESR